MRFLFHWELFYDLAHGLSCVMCTFVEHVYSAGGGGVLLLVLFWSFLALLIYVYFFLLLRKECVHLPIFPSSTVRYGFLYFQALIGNKQMGWLCFLYRLNLVIVIATLLFIPGNSLCSDIFVWHSNFRVIKICIVYLFSVFCF